MALNALLEMVPAVREHALLVPLGTYPTPVTAALDVGLDVFIKREDLSATAYGGNKIRTLEMLFAQAQRRGAREIWSTGAYGSNHAVATALHASRAELKPAALLFPQPVSPAASENLGALIGSGAKLWPLRSIALFPFAYAMLMAQARERRAFIMAPGGATPLGALGHVSAALELCEQVRRGELPAPRTLIVPVGSTCTTAGLMVGFALAQRLGLLQSMPELVAVRVTPWPVTARFRIVSLAQRTARLLAHWSGVDVAHELASVPLRVDGRELGWGYGKPTRRGLDAITRFAPILPLDTTYSGKAAAGLLRQAHALRQPVLFWSTKSSMPLPQVTDAQLARAPRHLQRFVRPGIQPR